MGKVTFVLLFVIGLNATSVRAASNSYLLWTKQGVPCSDDTITETSLNNALNAIANGVLNVPLSQNGCIRYIREMSGSEVTSERFTLAGQDTVVWTHAAALLSGREDTNFDGFFEKRTTIDRTPNQEKIEFVTYSQSPQTIMERMTHTRNGQMFHVVWEKYLEATEELTIISEYDLPYAGNTALGVHIANNASTGSLAMMKSGCDSTQQRKLEELYKEALTKGYDCMAKHGRPDIGLAMYDAIVSNNPPEWTCGVISGWPWDEAALAIFVVYKYLLFDDVEIKINSNPDHNFWTLSHEEQLNVIFHELLHATMPNHDPNMADSSDPNWEEKLTQFDRVYACAGLCFPRGVYDHNPCACATCLQTKTCDKRCSVKPGTCRPVLSQCRCGSNKGKYYFSSLDCNVVCPSGLFCFGQPCVETHNLMCEY